MKIGNVWRLRGPNRYLSRPVLIARVDLGTLTERETHEFAGFVDRILQTLPGLADHHCAAGRPGGFVERLYGGTYFGHVAEHIMLELSGIIGRDVTFGRTTWAGRAGLYEILTECPRDEPADSTVGESLLKLAIDLVHSTLTASPSTWKEQLEDIRKTYEREKPGPSTQAIASAARKRGIPVERIGSLSLLRLGYGKHRRMVWAAMTSSTSAIGMDIVADKQLTREMLGTAGIPVPSGHVAYDSEEAVRLLNELGAPVVVKPRCGRQGTNVFLNLRTAPEVRAAFATADEGDGVVVEHHLTGRDYRVLVLNGKVVAAAERCPAHVVGDGKSTVTELVAATNKDPRRGDGHSRVLTKIALDSLAVSHLDQQGLNVASVPAAGQQVWLRATANLSTGGTSRDVTAVVHPDVADLCRRTAAVVGMDLAGIDLRLPDIAEPISPTRAGGRPEGGIIEVNAAPGLRMHLAPTEGSAIDVGAAIVEALYSGATPSRIPTIAVTGTNGKTTTARLTAHLLAEGGRRVGVSSTDGVYIAGKLIYRADATGPASAQMILADPTVDVAVLETARGGILRRGLGYDWTDVAIVTNIDAEHLGQDGIDTVEELIDVKSVVAERVRDGGTLIFNADDANVRSLTDVRLVGADRKEVVWFSLDAHSALVHAHIRSGGRAYVHEDGWLVEYVGEARTALLPAAEMPGAFGGAAPHAIANALAAVAAVRTIGAPDEIVSERLRSFDPWLDNPGRGMLWQHGDVHLLIDYAHNAHGIAAMAHTVAAKWGRERGIALVNLPGDRRDDLLESSAHAIADGFDRVVVYDGEDMRGRQANEVPSLVCNAIATYRPQTQCLPQVNMVAALTQALEQAKPGDVILWLYEKIDPVLDYLTELGATPVSLEGESAPLMGRTR